MTIEQLEELIEQKGTVYDTDGSEIELYSKDKCHIVSKFNGKDDYLLVRYANVFKYISISHFMDKEHYEWRQRTVAERTERFEPPMWEDIKLEDGYEFKFFDVNNEYYAFRVIKNTYTVICVDDYKNIFEEVSTKENYEKACEIVRDLFVGEK